MPPKKQQTKNEKAKANKKAEDKTFGMKNKNRSTKVQKFIQQQTSSKSNVELEKEKQAKKKREEQKRKEELSELMKPVQVTQTVPIGTDPKTVLCTNFKNGYCEKGNRCRFSHDPNIERKTQKINLYADTRVEKSDDTMDKWDQEKLEQVVKSKAGKQPPTDIVCKYFLEAIEDNKYGWFWDCPNGGLECKYRHALPPGFILRSKDAKKEVKEEISLEEFLETERHKLGPNLTPVTLESFNKWKESRQIKKDADEAEVRKAKESRWKAGRSQGMSGRDLFDFNPSLATEEDDYDDAIDLNIYDRSEAEKERDRQESERLNSGMANLSVKESSTKENEATD